MNIKQNLQKNLEDTRVGKKFMNIFYDLCHNNAKSDLASIFFNKRNYNAHEVDKGVYDHEFAINILKELSDKERQEIYEITKKYLKNEYSELGGLIANRDALFYFKKSHNSFQKLHHAEKDFENLFEGKFMKMAERDIQYNSPRLNTYFGYNLFVGAPFDDKTNIRIQLYHSIEESSFPKTGFYIYVGEGKVKTKYFLDCFYNGTYFEIKEVTKQEGLSWTKWFGVEQVPEKDLDNNYYDGLVKEFGKNIFIDKDPFSESEGNNLILLEKYDNEPINMDGGSEYYYHKYIKYKNKYLELKKLN